MKLEIKDFYSPDIEEIWLWEAKSSLEFYFLLELSIGEVGKDEADIFQVIITSPKGLEKHSKFILVDRATIVLNEYDWHKLVSFLNEILIKCESDSWTQSTVKLQRYFYWEYEDYVEDDGEIKNDFKGL